MKARPSLRPLLSAPQVSLGLIRQSGPCDDWLSFNHPRHSLWHSERRCQVPAVLCNVSGVHQGVWTKGWVPRVWDKPRCGFNDGPFIVSAVQRLWSTSHRSVVLLGFFCFTWHSAVQHDVDRRSALFCVEFACCLLSAVAAAQVSWRKMMFVSQSVAAADPGSAGTAFSSSCRNVGINYKQTGFSERWCS